MRSYSNKLEKINEELQDHCTNVQMWSPWVEFTPKGDSNILITKNLLTSNEIAKIWYFDNDVKVHGPHSNITGDVTDLTDDVTSIYGNVNCITGNVTNLRGYVSNICGDVSNIFGDVSRIRGDVTNISGYVTNIRGDVTNLHGNIYDCQVTGMTDVSDLVTG